MASAINVRIDDVGSILKFRIGFPFGENSAGFCRSVWHPGSILNFCIGSVSSIGGLIAATLFADTINPIPRPRTSASQRALRGSLRGLCGVSRRVLRGLSEGSAGNPTEKPEIAKNGALRKGPPFHGSRSSREIKIQNASCQMGDRVVTRR